MTYAEYLKSLGATDEDVKVLDTAIGRKAFEKMQADTAAAVTAANTAAQERMETYRGEVVTWQNGFMETVDQAKANEIAAQAEAARTKEILRGAAASNEALRKVAENAGWKFDDKGNATPPAPEGKQPPAGPKDYYTKEELANVMRQEREAIILAHEIPAEHARLFPGQPFSFRALVDEAEKAKKPADQYWREKYKVDEARAKVIADAKAAELEAARKDEREKVTREMADKYGNPALRPPMPSSNPFAKAARPDDNKQPWERQQTETDRVAAAAARVKESLLKQGLTVQ